MATTRVLTWNIRHGGGRRIESIVRAIAAHDADVAVLIEFRTIPGIELRRLLAAAGYRFALEAPLAPRQNGVAIVSRAELVPSERATPRAVPKHRWLEADIPALGMSVGAFYGPLEDVPYARWWRSVRRAMADRVSLPFVLAGDFNTGMSIVDAPRNPFYCAEHFEALQDMGMADAWRRSNPDIREYSWYSRRAGRDLNGFRLDHLLASPSLADSITAARYSHAERESSTSDHSILLVDFERAEVMSNPAFRGRSVGERFVVRERP